METICRPSLRRLALALAGCLIVLVPALGTASKAEAGLYVIPDVTLKSRSVVEGNTTVFKTKLTCPFQECTYRFFTAPGTAKVTNTGPGTVDYNLFAYTSVTLTKGQRKAYAFKVKTLNDTVCEPNEYFFVNVEGTWSGINDRYGGPAPLEKQAKVTIRGGDCVVSKPGDIVVNRPATPPTSDPKPAPAPEPTPAPAPSPGDSTSGMQTTTVAGSSTIARCVTDQQAGVLGQNGAWGNYIPGCTVKLTCPLSVAVCRSSSESRINTESYIGHRVTLNSRMRAFSASDTEFWHRDVSCDNSDWCAAEDLVMIRGGESSSVQCNGVRQNGPQANRAKVTCQLTLESND